MDYDFHHGNERAYIRDFILGINDGLISTFLLTIGVYTSGRTLKSILLTIISCALSGMISMGLGEYFSTKSQKEKIHIKEHLDLELCHVKDIGIKNDFLVENNKDGLLEFGLAGSDEDNRSPLITIVVSGGLFFIGSIPTLISFSITNDIHIAFYLAIGLNIITLFAVGSVKTFMTKTNIVFSRVENLLLGTIGAVISYSIGYLFSNYLL
jgi:VIT1/CCC1 family predicted Fe2+/Mn2+ transporter